MKNCIRLCKRHWKALLGLGLIGTAAKLCLALPYQPVQRLPAQIVDMHCHVAGIGAGGSGCFVSAKLKDSWKFDIYLKAFGVTRAEIESQGDALVADRISQTLSRSRYVSKAVLLAMDGVVTDGRFDTNRTEVYVPNEFVASVVARHTNLLFGASVNPYRPDALERLAWAKTNGAVLVKWIPSIMEIDPADPRLEVFYRKMVELNLPLLTHAGQERSFSGATDSYCDPGKLRYPLSLGVRVIAAHIASTGSYEGERSSERLARLMPEHTNLFSEISSLTQINKHFFLSEALQESRFNGRLLYGTDFPLINTALVSPWHYGLRLSGKQLWEMARTENPWDKDVLLKHYLGTPAEVFARGGEWLSVPKSP
ncbi:MAG: amidohydrolase family protein [Verrucomicrobiota bacterium]